MNFSGKTAVVTGASRGIGRAICVALAKRGLNVAANYVGDDSEVKETLALCPDPGKAAAINADVSNYEECKRLFDECQKKFGPPDYLVNNAGITRDGLLMRMTEEDFDTVISVNLKSAFNCVKLASRMMMKSKFGRIVSISSVVALSGNPGQVNYCASKAGLLGLTKASAKEFAPRGITVNAVAPGFIMTNMTKDLPEEVKASMMGQIPLGFFGEADDIASAVLFLCSDEARYITGQTISVNGGMYC